MQDTDQRSIAYFSMEIALQANMPTYSGGLGVLAGDTIRSAADLELPMVAVSLLYRKGYFFQQLDETGWQTEEPMNWEVDDFLDEVPVRTSVRIEDRMVQIRAWKYKVKGLSGHTVPVYFLDTDLPDNSDWDRTLTHTLYGGDQRYRLCQEVILGIGGAEILHEMGYDQIRRYHMNEGHASLLTLALLNRSAQQHDRTAVTHEDIEAVREQCVFTTHTPVPAGHDKFPMELVAQVLPQANHFVDMEDPFSVDVLKRVLGMEEQDFHNMEEVLQSDGRLNMTFLALHLSHYVNGVAKKHGEVSRLMFGNYPVDSITNGVHAPTWVSDPFQKLFDEYISGWRKDNFSLRYAMDLPKEAVRETHREAKKQLLYEVQHQTNVAMDQDVLTIGFARRMTPYKRADLLFTDLNRLRAIAEEVGPIQIIYAGKAHPRDDEGKRIIQRIFSAKDALEDVINIAYLTNYDTTVGRLMTAGVDLWLNTPKPPNEASGTSGMKAALNGVPQLSILDGWWLEGWIEGVTGWAIGDPNPETSNRVDDAASLYNKLSAIILPMYYDNPSDYTEVRRQAIAINGSFFHTQRMIQEYVLKAYF